MSHGFQELLVTVGGSGGGGEVIKRALPTPMNSEHMQPHVQYNSTRCRHDDMVSKHSIELQRLVWNNCCHTITTCRTLLQGQRGKVRALWCSILHYLIMELYEIVYVHIMEAGCIVFFLQYPVILL